MKKLEDVIEDAALAIATNVAADLIVRGIERKRTRKAPDPETCEMDKGKEAK